MKTIIANWKMNAGVRESVALARGTLLTLRGRKLIPDLVICPSFVALSEVRKVVGRSSASLGAQNMGYEDKGALTGEISARMLSELSVTHVILGHSERRQKLFETDEMVNQKTLQALSNGLTPIVCVGETKDQRDDNKQQEVVKSQLIAALDHVRLKSSQKLFIAYEPIWAISSGKNPHLPSVAEIVEMHAFINDVLSSIFPTSPDGQLSVLYGGSVDGENAYGFLREQEIGGVLVGGASVKLNQFKEVISAALDVLESQEQT